MNKELIKSIKLAKQLSSIDQETILYLGKAIIQILQKIEADEEGKAIYITYLQNELDKIFDSNYSSIEKARLQIFHSIEQLMICCTGQDMDELNSLIVSY